MKDIIQHTYLLLSMALGVVSSRKVKGTTVICVRQPNMLDVLKHKTNAALGPPWHK